MKKLLLALSALFITCSLRADLVWYEGFNYADGATTNVSSGVWAIHSTGGSAGTPAGNDSFIRNGRLEVSGNSSTNAPRQSDVNRRLCSSLCTYTNGLQIMYASFTVVCTNLPVPGVINYFAHFNGANNQQGRVFYQSGSLPGTWQLGVGAGSAAPNKVFPVNLARDAAYQVVIGWNPTAGVVDNIQSAGAKMWVNPIGSTDVGLETSDSGFTPAVVTAYSFRQAAGTTSFFANITNLAVATTFDEAATNVWSTNAVTPIIAVPPQSSTNFVNNDAVLTSVAAGQSLGNFVYGWLKDGALYTNPQGNTNVLVIPNAVESDSGNYQMFASTPYGLSVTSAVASLWVTNPPIPPVFVTQPASVSVASGANITLTSQGFGPGVLNYQWNHYGTNLPGETNPTLTLNNVRTNNGNTGLYTVGITNSHGGILSTNALVVATNPPQVSIAYIRTLVNAGFAPTNGTALWSVTGTVTTFTNQTSANTSSYYLQDATAGVNIFVTLGSSFRPALGDVLTFVGLLSTFQGTLELVADASNPSTSYTVLSNNPASIPAPRVISFFPTGNTNNSPTFEALEGTLVMITNVYFGTNAGTVIPTNSNPVYVVTNGNGQSSFVNFSQQDLDTAGQTLPSYAYSIVGPLNQATNTHAGYQVTVTKFSDIVTDAPPAVTVSVATVGKTKVLTWPAVPYKYSYSLLSSTNVNGPYLPEMRYEAVLKAVNEVPAITTTAIGFGTVAVSPDLANININERWENIAAPASASHIHGPAAVGATAGVLIGFSSVPAVTTGAIPEQTQALGLVNYGYLTNGLLYMNVHDGTYGSGEIRGQLYPQPSVGLTFTTTNGTYTDVNTFATNKFYKIVSP